MNEYFNMIARMVLRALRGEEPAPPPPIAEHPAHETLLNMDPRRPYRCHE